MLRLAWLTIAQHVFQPALTGRLELILRKIVSCELGTKAFAVSRFREKLSPQIGSNVLPRFHVKYRTLGHQKMGANRDISNSAIYTTAIYREYTV